MRKFGFVLLAALFVISCNSEKKTPKVLTAAQQIANAHGLEQWNNVERIDFTFSVVVDSSRWGDRSWSWEPSTGDIRLVTDQDSISYNRSSIDSTNLQADQRFINDKFWLLVPFQLVWDEGTNISDPEIKKAPMSGLDLNSITVSYSGEGGYTPGDTYEVFYDEAFEIKEWVYQSADTLKPPRSYSFENYKDYNGIRIATVHKKMDSDISINFSGIEVVFKD